MSPSAPKVSFWGSVLGRVKVVYVDSVRDFGGGEVHILSIIDGLDRNRFQIEVVCHPENQLAKECKKRKIPYYPIKLKSKFSLFGIVRLSRLLHRLRPDIVHLEDTLSHWLGSFASRLAGVPIIIATVHMVNIYRTEKPFSPLKRGVYIWADCLWTSLVTKVATVSEFNRQKLIGEERIPGGKVVTITSATDVKTIDATPKVDKAAKKKEFGIDPEFPVIGMVGRLSSQKGFPYLLEAASLVKKSFPRVRFMIVGDGPLREEVEVMVRDLGLESTVILTGWREDVYALYQIFDIVALSSLFEGLPITILDGMASSKPVVATDVCGNPEVVRDSETGLLVPPRNPRVLAEAILTLLRDPQRAVAMGEAGRKLVEKHYTTEILSQRTAALYGELLKLKGYG